MVVQRSLNETRIFLLIMNSLSRFEISGQLEISFNRLADELLADRSITPVFSFISYMNQ